MADQFVQLVSKHFTNTQRIELPSIEDFDVFRQLCLMNVDKSEKVQKLSKDKDPYDLITCPIEINQSNSNVTNASKTCQLYRLTLESADLDPFTMYKMLHDAVYRKKWDHYMISGFNLIPINNFTDTGFYSFQIPMMSTRYSVAQRCWHQWSESEQAIFNHSVNELPKYFPIYDANKAKEIKNAIKVISYISGYYMKKDMDAKKTKFVYMTCSDIQTPVPNFILKMVSKSNIPKFVNNLLQMCREYPKFEESNPGTLKPEILGVNMAVSRDSDDYKKYKDEMLSKIKS